MHHLAVAWFFSTLFLLRDRFAFPPCAHLEAVGDQLLLVCFFSSVIFALLPWKHLTTLFVFVLLHIKNGERRSGICGCSPRYELPQPSGVSWTDHNVSSFILPALFSMAETPALHISSAALDGKPMRF